MVGWAREKNSISHLAGHLDTHNADAGGIPPDQLESGRIWKTALLTNFQPKAFLSDQQQLATFGAGRNSERNSERKGSQTQQHNTSGCVPDKLNHIHATRPAYICRGRASEGPGGGTHKAGQQLSALALPLARAPASPTDTEAALSPMRSCGRCQCGRE